MPFSCAKCAQNRIKEKDYEHDGRPFQEHELTEFRI